MTILSDWKMSMAHTSFAFHVTSSSWLMASVLTLGFAFH